MVLIPEPRSIKTDRMRTFDFSKIKLGASPLNETAQNDFLQFAGRPQADAPNILFQTDRALAPEAYRLNICEKITIFSRDGAGAFYALQTLKQILLQCGDQLPYCEIEDAPAFAYRGMMLDVGRYFYTVEDVKAVLDRMALHKLNLLHLHLTEDQGWRIQIDRYPMLTAIGARRSYTNFNRTPHKGYYTKAQIREIVDYAHTKQIKVMPEFDMPGHCRAAIAAYPALSCFDRELPVATHWGVKHDVLCAGKEETYRFIFDVLDEMLEMFPDGYFHIGGDEVPKHRWHLCPHCRQKMRENGLKDEDELQEYFMNRVYKYLTEHGAKHVFMWNYDKLQPRILDKHIAFSLCGGEEKARDFTDTSAAAYYFDLPYGRIPLQAVCDHQIPAQAMGAEGQLWSEYLPNLQKCDIMAFPRTGALAESAWSGGCSWAGFQKKLQFYYTFLEANGISHAAGARLNPKGLRKALDILWFEKRQLTWEGLHNLIDDRYVEHLAKKRKAK